LKADDVAYWRAGRPCTRDNSSTFPLRPAANSADQAGKVNRLNDAYQCENSSKVVQVKELESSAESDKEKQCCLNGEGNR
jgi:hypothetical protein